MFAVCVFNRCICMYMCVRSYVTGHHCEIYPFLGSCIPDLVPVPLHTLPRHTNSTHTPQQLSAVVQWLNVHLLFLPSSSFLSFSFFLFTFSPPSFLISCHYCAVLSIPIPSLPFPSFLFHS